MAYQHLIKQVKDDINTIRSILNTNQNIRNLILDSPNNQKYQAEGYLELINSLKKNIPKDKDWIIYDHCSAVTKLYAIYESLVESLITEWLATLPTLYSYQDLPEKIKNTHKEGVGRLLRETNKIRYKDLTINQVINGLYAGINNQRKYDLIAEAFLFHEQNLRKNILEKLLGDVNLSDTWQWISRHRKIKYFIEEIRGNQTTIESELNTLIDYRNDAAHGGIIENFLGFNELIEFCDFIKSLCVALVELFEFNTIKCQEDVGKARKVGQITEWYKNPQAAVAKIENVKLSITDNIILLSETYCQPAIIKSLQDEKEKSVERIEAIQEREVGLKFDVDARKGLLLYVIE